MNRLSRFNVVSLALGFAFLYLPMLILVIFSFNKSKLVTVWAGFSTKWYGELLNNEAFLDAAWVTLKVALISSSIATILGRWRLILWCAAGGSLAALCSLE
jgi:putrescine transport system permease protein